MRTTYKCSPSTFDGVQQRRWFDPHAELLALPAHLAPDVPLGFTLTVCVDGAPARLQLTTELRLEGGDSLADVIVFDREELRALIAGVEADRIWRKDLLGICFDKWRKPDHRLTSDAALAGANPDEDETNWSLGRVLARIGATVESIELANDLGRAVGSELSRAA